MTGISTSVQLVDRVSGSLNRITAALVNSTTAFGALDKASDLAFNPAGVQAMSQEMYGYESRIQQLESDLVDAHRRLEEMEKQTREAADAANTLKKAFSAIGSIVAAIGIGQMVSSAIEYASDLQEVQNVVDVTFGQNSAINEWSKNTLEAFGLNELSAKRFSGTLGAMLKSSGLAGDSVQDMSMSITELAGDMASFYNLDAEEAFNKIRSGISGETEPLKQLGINMSVANLEAFALSQGIQTAYSEMSQAEQVTLRYNYLMQATADAQGDFARTSDSYANQVKLLKENWLAFTGSLATKALPILAGGIKILNNGIEAISNNWDIIAPILTGLIAMVGAYATALGIYNAAKAITLGLEAAHAFAAQVSAAAQMMQTGATFAATAAQYGFNAALLACPITWILLIIIAVIAAIYAIVAAVNKAQGTTVSATGVIFGAIATVVAAIWNIILGVVDLILGAISTLYNKWIMFANFFGNLFRDPIGSIIHLFGDMADSVLGIIETIARALDKVFGSSMADTVGGWRSSLDEKIEAAANKYGNGKYEAVAEEVNWTSESLGLKRWAYSDAYNAGYELGEKVEDKVSGIFSEEGLFDAVNDIANNTGDIADSVSVSSENLKYLRDIAEQEIVNRFTTAEIKVDMTNNNNISSSMDIDGIINTLSDGLLEAMAVTAEGVH